MKTKLEKFNDTVYVSGNKVFQTKKVNNCTKLYKYECDDDVEMALYERKIELSWTFIGRASTEKAIEFLKENFLFI